ncbi:hypothetical protein SAMN02910370_00704 [Lachnospiraceae bacterium XPB1003]|nr:hypothetical protein SAMN02910370_00704 [Lachnospiraceae bacterium XPB1003]
MDKNVSRDNEKILEFWNPYIIMGIKTKARCEMPRREGAGRPKMEDPKANKVSMRLSNEELVRFEAYAKKHGLSKADTLRKAVEELIKRDK